MKKYKKLSEKDKKHIEEYFYNRGKSLLGTYEWIKFIFSNKTYEEYLNRNTKSKA